MQVEGDTEMVDASKADKAEATPEAAPAAEAEGVTPSPAKDGEDATAALTELVAVFKKNFEEYATNARKAMALKGV